MRRTLGRRIWTRNRKLQIFKFYIFKFKLAVRKIQIVKYSTAPGGVAGRRSNTTTTGMAPTKSKTWCFTRNNPQPSPDGETKDHWRTCPEAIRILDQECQVLIIGYEVGDTGTEHLQGYITYKYSKTLTAMKKIMPQAHWTVGRSKELAANYCMKDWDYVKKDYRKQGQREDIRAAIDTMLKHGVKRVKKDHPLEFLKYGSKWELLDVINEDKRDFRPDVLWLWGTTGTGKSYYAKTIYPEQERWWSGKNLRWWLGYRGEPIVIIDDFRKDFCTYHELLRILDENPYKVETKGSHRELNAKLIIITTIQPPLEMYRNQLGEHLDQLTRRITKIYETSSSPIPGGGTMYSRKGGLENKPFKHDEALSAVRGPSGGTAVSAIADRAGRTAPATNLDAVLTQSEGDSPGEPPPSPSSQRSYRRSPEPPPEGVGGVEAEASYPEDGSLSANRWDQLQANSRDEYDKYVYELAQDDADDAFFNVPEGL